LIIGLCHIECNPQNHAEFENMLPYFPCSALGMREKQKEKKRENDNISMCLAKDIGTAICHDCDSP